MAGFGGFKVLSVDYRMPPDHPYPAGLDDAVTAWKAATTMARPKNMAIFEGQSHAQYYRDVNAPETKEAFEEIARFFDKHLGK